MLIRQSIPLLDDASKIRGGGMLTGTPVWTDRYTSPRFVLRRSPQIRSSGLASVRRGDWHGRELRSTKPESPCSHQRPYHLATVPRNRRIFFVVVLEVRVRVLTRAATRAARRRSARVGARSAASSRVTIR